MRPGRRQSEPLSMSTITYAHIEFTPDGVPLVAGTTTKVIEVALDRIAHGWSADEIHRQHPHLSLAQIHAALTYYYDHRLEMDAVIREQVEEVERLRAEVDDSAIRETCISGSSGSSEIDAEPGSFPDRIRLPPGSTRLASWENVEDEPEWDPAIYAARLAVERFYGP